MSFAFVCTFALILSRVVAISPKFVSILEKVLSLSIFFERIRSYMLPNTGNGVLGGKYLILSKSDALSYVGNHY